MEIIDLFTLKISLPETLWDVFSHCYQVQIKYIERKTKQVRQGLSIVDFITKSRCNRYRCYLINMLFMASFFFSD